ncbi:MAG: HAD family hydrolase [Armatimonadota bacterium]
MSQNHSKKIRVVLVDVDGTLIDTNDAHAHAWVAAFAESGKEVPFAAVRPLIGMGGDQLLPKVVGIEKDTEEGKAISDAWTRLFKERYLPTAQPFPGAADLLQRIHDQGIKIVAATSGEEDLADALLDKVGVRDLLTARTSSADAKRSKPAPDLIEAALTKGGSTADEAIMLGDTPYDIEAAKAAGVGVIAFRCGGFPPVTLQGALAIYDDPADLLLHWDSSPLAKMSP